MYSKLQDGSFMVCGYVARDAELKTTQTGKSLCTWSIKVGEKPSPTGGERGEAIWTNCQAWHGAARIASMIKKGDTVFAVGKISVNEYEGKTYKNLVCEFVSIMKDAPAVSHSSEPYIANTGDLSAYEEILSDGEVPF